MILKTHLLIILVRSLCWEVWLMISLIVSGKLRVLMAKMTIAEAMASNERFRKWDLR